MDATALSKIIDRRLLEPAFLEMIKKKAALSVVTLLQPSGATEFGVFIVAHPFVDHAARLLDHLVTGPAPRSPAERAEL